MLVLAFPNGTDKTSDADVICLECGVKKTTNMNNARNGEGCCNNCANTLRRGVCRRLPRSELETRYEESGNTLLKIHGVYQSTNKTESTQRCHICGQLWQTNIRNVLHHSASCPCLYRETFFYCWSTVTNKPDLPIHVYYAKFENLGDPEDRFYKIGISKYVNRFGNTCQGYSVKVKILATTTLYIGYLREQQTLKDHKTERFSPPVLEHRGAKGASECFHSDVLGLFKWAIAR